MQEEKSLKAKNEELKIELAQKTLDLQLMKRELEIETALERVRAVAMGMKKAEEMIGICEITYRELKALGFSNIRNAQITMNRDEKGTYHIFEYSDYSRLIMIEGNKNMAHPLMREYADEMEKSKDAFFQKQISGKEFESWRAWRHSISSADDPKIMTASSLCIYHYSTGAGALGISSFDPITTDQLEILKRFKNVFELAYTRYADVAMAEAQAKEARIETALERIRSRSMGMQKSDELKEVIRIVYEQFIYLNILIEHTGFIIDYKESDDMHIWLADKNDVPAEITIPYFDSPHWNSFIEAKEKGLDFFANQLTFEEKNKFYEQLFELFPGTPVPDETKEYYFNCPGLAISTVLLENVCLYIENFSGIPFTNEENATLMRFGKVFQQTYTRFLDLQKAEVQAREGQIEASLERVRSKTMAMYNSKDIGDTVATMFDELVKLGVEKSVRCGVGIIDESKHLELWTATNTDGNFGLIIGRVDMTVHPMLEGAFAAWKNKEPFYTYLLEGSDRDNYFNALIASPEYRTPYTLEIIPERQINSVFFFPEGCLFAFTTEPMSAEMMQLFKRFTAVFGLTYRRYTDLQKAEAQTTESQIQLALERVRARTMAMQKSYELHEVIQLVFDQLHQLNFNIDVANFVLDYTKTDDFDLWLAVADRRYPTKMYIPYFDHPIFKRFNNAKVHGGLFTDVSSYEEKNSFFEHFFKYIAEIPEERKAQIFDSPGYVRSTVLIKNIALTISNYGTIPYSGTENAMLIRFGTVFEQTYTRFLDLKQAETQAKESQIQLALERVRSRTMAMHHSGELSQTVFILFQQFKELGENPDQATIGIINEDEQVIEYWVTMYGSQDRRVFKFSIDEPDVTHKIYIGWKEQQKSLVIDLTGKALKDFSDYRASKGGAAFNADEKQRVINVAFFSKGLINVQSTSERSEESLKLLERFAVVFDGTYTRFLDLKQAEAQAREAQIAAGLERVRSRTLAMQSSDELADTAAVVFKQLIGLGIEPNRLFIGIINNDDKGDVELWATDEDGSKVSTRFTGNINRNGSVKKMYDGWKQQLPHITIDMHGEELKDYFHYLADELKVPFKLGLNQQRRIQSIAYFSKGLIGMASPDEQPAETIKLLERFASVFNLTFVRFHDLQVAEAHAVKAEQDLILLQTEKKRAEDALVELKSTQTQLVQKEKMASLGELTAGIAHEIQNPLDFVNNFSEVNQEMIDELEEELKAGNIEDALAIIADIKQNEEKINHHGRRADSIVRGMLQHSRASSGEKAPTNINALADEFFKLSYHGLRAKDKNFNAEMVTRFEEVLPKIEVVQQDIGRVLLNLFNNAFYAVNEKKKTTGVEYRPTVELTTFAPTSGGWGVSVKDNGIGIPDAIKEKIMQPFFTTKPTGEGTGLGLSLSYDIVVKGHGGNIAVDTKEGEFTEFTIQIPAK